MENDRYSIQESTGYWVSLLARSMERDFEKRLAPLGITRGSFALLSAIHHERKTRPAELSAFLGVDGAAITRQLDRVEKKGLIKRVPSTSDRRATDIAVTDEGIEVVRKGQEGSSATNDKFTTALTTAEVKQLHSVIQTILAKANTAVTGL